jgi:hypothetical protein
MDGQTIELADGCMSIKLADMHVRLGVELVNK